MCDFSFTSNVARGRAQQRRERVLGGVDDKALDVFDERRFVLGERSLGARCEDSTCLRKSVTVGERKRGALEHFAQLSPGFDRLFA